MKFIITQMTLNIEGEGQFSITPDHWVFTFEQIGKPRLLNSTTEVVLLKGDERVESWIQAFHEKREFIFDITIL